MSVPDFFNYDTIREEDGKRFLFDTQKYNRLSEQLKKYAGLLKEARALLAKYDYPDSREWQGAIMSDGENGLKNIILSESDAQAKRLSLPRFLAVQWRTKALADAPEEMFEEANSLYVKLNAAGEGLNIRPEDIKYNKAEEPSLNIPEREKRLAAACSLEITPQMRGEVEKIQALIPQLRELNEAGVDIEKVVVLFLGNRYAPSMYPALDELKILDAVRRTRKFTKKELYMSNKEAYYLSGGERV